jgi:hypothetical protein
MTPLAKLGKSPLLPTIVVALVPILLVFAIEIPIKEMLSSLVGALV